MTEQDRMAAWEALTEAERQALMEQVDAMAATLPRRRVSSWGECNQGCREMQSMMMQNLASMYPGGNVPPAAARAVEIATEQCFDKCKKMY